MSYSIDPLTEDCYPGTTVLQNKLGIMDEAQLEEAEAMATFLNAAQLLSSPIDGQIDFSEVDMDLLMLATIQATQGVTDNLRQFFTEAITKA